jgi:hypothetical protein
MMALSSDWQVLMGDWSGTNAFRMMPDDDYTSSPASLAIQRGPGDGTLLVRYTWAHEGTTHHGLLLVTAGDDGAAEAVWLDSFHQQPQWMTLSGALHEGGRVTVAGTYAEVWGWRISIDPTDGIPELVMDNVPPAGEPYPVVHLIADPR